MISRSKSLFAAFGFFLSLLAWIAAKMAYSSTDEFPRLSLLCKWDCGWYESIARQGYLSPIPPLFQNSEASNVAFFPAYPLLGRTIAGLLGIPLTWALPLGSILCAILVSLAIAKLLASERSGSRRFRYAILFAYPATFYLFVSYSEALYLSAMLGGTAIAFTRGRTAWGLGLLALAGLVLGGTRLTGFVVPSFLALGAALFAWRERRLRALVTDPVALSATLYLFAAAAGTAAFFLFCHFRFGHWNLYFQQLAIGWYKEFNPGKALALFFHPLNPPTLDYETLQADSRRLSWMLIDTMVVICAYAGVRAARSALVAFHAADRATFLRCFLVFAAIAHFGIVICGDVGPWDAWGNGLRYPMPTAYLLAIAWRDEWTPAIVRERPILRRTAYALAAVVLAFLFAHQVGYLGRFIRNEWVS